MKLLVLWPQPIGPPGIDREASRDALQVAERGFRPDTLAATLQHVRLTGWRETSTALCCY